MKWNINLFILTCTLLATYSVAGSFIDKRDGQKYKTIKIGEQTWMADNLRYRARLFYCFDGYENNCQKFGRMYPWHIAMNLSPQKAYDNEESKEYVKKEHQGICPNGWHIPSVEEFDTLASNIGSLWDDSPRMKRFSSDYREAAMLDPPGGFKEIDALAAARFYKKGKSGEYPLNYVYKDLNHFIAFATTDVEGETTCDYGAYSDNYNFAFEATRIYRGAAATYIRCVKNFECPKGEELYEGLCQKPFDCNDNEYFVDKWNCQTLPENGQRNKGTGFSCKKGFVKVKEYDEYVCKELVKCGDDEYNVSRFECALLPNHSKKTKNGFTCDKGYDKVKEDRYYECIKPYSCGEAEYSISKYKCKLLPQNAHRDDKTKVGFKCDEGYDGVEFAGEIYCRKAYDCQENEYSLGKYECKILPPNAHKNEKEGFSCDEGYDLYQGECYPLHLK